MPLPTPPPLARSLLLLLLSLLSVATLNTHERVLARLAARGDERVKRQLPTEINIQNGTRRAELGAVPAVTAELVEVAGVEATIYRKRRQTIQELSFVRARGRFEREIVEIVSLPPVTAPLFSSRLFDYGTEEGDEQVPGGAVDVGKRLELTYPLTFFNRQHRTVYILSNGGIGFDPSSRSYTTELFPGGPEMIAPFWNRNNMRKGGKVYYRELKEGARVLERGQSEIRYQYDKNVKARSGLLVTWVGMQPLGPEALPEDNTNTFQALILQTDNGTYANFIYKNIGWTQGARAGFNKGAEEEFYELPTSGTGNIMYLEEYGNTGIPGEWIFEIDMPKIVRCKSGTKGDTCDQTCAASEWGYDCAGCCHCAAGGKCDVSNGQCQGGGGQCAECWTGFPLCQERQSSCRVQSQTCAHNAISFTDYDRCGEPLVRCQCLAGYTGDGHSDCQVLDLSGDREDGGEDDVDECAGETSPCHRNAICVNTPGRYYCECRPGFTGDGINDCSEAFLYPFLDHQSLPRRRDSKVVWDLQYEFFIFGRPRGQLIISDQGLIAVSDLPRELRDPLADGVIGFAPFFAPVDLSLGGNVFVDEASDAVQPEVVQRATNVVREMYGETAFVAKTVFIVTFHNVTNQGGRALNTYQMNLIGGILPGGRQATYVEYLYKDLEWSSGAEAAIIPEDGANAIVLPGSKTQGIVQLAQLSNLAKPGQWMWRVDGGLVEQCPRRDLQPPYCDQTIQAPPPRPQPPRQPFLPQPQQPQPPPITRPAAGEEIPIEFQPRTIQPTLDESDDARRVTVTFPPFITVIPQLFTPPQSVVAIRARPDNTPPSRNGLILPPQVTQPERPRTNGPQTSRTRVTPPPGLSRAGTPDFGEDTETDPPFRYTDPPRFQPTQPPFQHPETDQPPGFPPPLRETLRPLYPPTPQPQPEQPSRPDGRVPVGPPPQPSIIFGGQEFEPRAPQTPSPPSPSSPQSFFTPRTQQPPSIQFTRINPQQLPDDSLQHITPGPEYEREDENEGGFPPIQVFTTPRRRIPVPTRPPPVIISGPRTTTRSPFQTRPDDNALDTNNLGRRKDPEQDLNSPSKLAIIIPTAIVGVWLLLLLVIGLVVCCRRRKSRKRLRSKYDPSYHFRQSAVGAYPGGREPSAAAAALPQGRKHKDRHAGYPHASYEDHLEKAARLSEMSQYSSQQNGVGGRLYGSYWNVAGEGGGGGGRNRNQSTNYSYYNQGYYDSCPEFQQRYAYAGRY